MLRLGTSGVEPSCRSTSGVFGPTGRNSRYRAITPTCATPSLEDAKERGHRAHRLQPRDSLARFLQARFLGWVRGNHADAIIEGERRTVLNPAPYRPREVDEVADDR